VTAFLLYPICLYQLGTRALHHTINALTTGRPGHHTPTSRRNTT
jgi:hypothetical protein